ncbi:hypothetical protein M9H77_03260 [Catharanthus roseus]|uniref:Uncharacterized protein n=1 Tax=Catharanthus roseus TaxID=4058 RepID=A0ACC0CB02_CATRO|nr:hypothetical protein M9H77_03260 [Catharanthus roseus]
MEAVLSSQMSSSQNMENHIELIAKRILEEPLSHIPSNTAPLQDVEEQLITFPMFMDDDDRTAQEPRSPLPKDFNNFYRIQVKWKKGVLNSFTSVTKRRNRAPFSRDLSQIVGLTLALLVGSEFFGTSKPKTYSDENSPRKVSANSRWNSGGNPNRAKKRVNFGGRKNNPNQLGASSLLRVEDNDEADESYNPSDDEEDEASAQNTIPMDTFQTEMQTAFELLRINQEVQGMQLTEIVQFTRRYADELAHRRASIDHQKVMLAYLCQRFMPDQGSIRGGGMDFGPR